MADELRALTRLTFDELGAGDRWDRRDPPGDRRPRVRRGRLGPPRALHDAISGGVYAGLRGGAASLAGLAAARGRRARPLAVGHAARRGGPRRSSTGCAATCSSARAATWRSRWRSGSAAAPVAPARVPGRAAAPRRLRARAVRDRARLGLATRLRRAPGARSRRHAGVRPLQHAAATSPRTGARSPRCSTSSSPSGRSRSSRSRWSATRWAGWWRAAPATPAATGPRLVAPHRLARLAAHRRAARVGRALRERGARRDAGDAAVRRLPAPPQRRHPRPALAARWSTRTGATATPRRCAPRRARRSRCSTGAAHHFVSATVTRDAAPSGRRG